jgi:Methyltransferase domain
MANQTSPQRRLLELGGVKVLDSDRFESVGRHIGPWELKAYAACDLATDFDMMISIYSDCVLCSGVGDTAYRARATGRIAGGRDGDGATYDETYAKYGIRPGEHNPNYTSTSVRNRFPFLWINPIFARSELASKEFIDRSIDAVFIDACHSEESVRNDILCWLPKIKEGGVVFGDDWAWRSVKRGVHSVFDPELVSPSRNGFWVVRL